MKTLNLMNIKFESLISRLEELILITILNAKQPISASDIRERIEDFTEKALSIGVLYNTLDRLEKKGMITSWEEGPTNKPGGRSKRIFNINKKGRDAISESIKFANKMHKELDNSLIA